MSGAGFAGALTAGDEYGRDAEVEALADIIFFGDMQSSASKPSAREMARAVLAAGYTRRPAASGGVPVEALRALADEWEATVYSLPPGYPMTVNEFCHRWFKAPLRALLDSATTDGGESGE